MDTYIYKIYYIVFVLIHFFSLGSSHNHRFARLHHEGAVLRGRKDGAVELGTMEKPWENMDKSWENMDKSW